MAGGLVIGRLLFRQRHAGRPLVAFSAYAVHLTHFYQALIRQLLRDDRVDVVLLTWPHPQFPLREQARLREVAVSKLGLDASHVRPLWKAMWWRFDLMVSCDALTPLPIPRTRTCQLFHGPMLQKRYSRSLLFRRGISDYDLVFAIGPYHRDIILGYAGGRNSRPRVCMTGGPQYDEYFHPERTKEDYMLGLGLDPSRPIVLYAPHWSELARAGRLGLQLLLETVEELRRLPVSVVVKLHAMSVVSGPAGDVLGQGFLGQLESRHVKVDRVIEDVDALLAADVLVTGISSRACNFMLLDKPVVLYRPHLIARHYKEQAGYSMLLTGAWLAEDVEELGACVRQAIMNPRAHRKQRADLREALFANSGHATEEVTRILYEEIELGRRKSGTSSTSLPKENRLETGGRARPRPTA